MALACTGGTPVNNSAGNEMKLPPPANAFRIPAIPATKNRKSAWPIWNAHQISDYRGMTRMHTTPELFQQNIRVGNARETTRLLHFFGFLPYRRQQLWRQRRVPFLRRESLAVSVYPI